MNKKIKSALTVSTYAKFGQFVSAFARGRIPLLMIIGDPGTSKSQTVRRSLKGETCWIDGQASAVSIYTELFKHRHRPVVIDDVDSLYAVDACRRLLKCLCQTDKEKEVSWRTQNRMLIDQKIPNSFITRSKTCIIANDWRTLNTDVAALEDRAVALLFKPTPLEVHLHAATWFEDQAVFDFMASVLHLVEMPSLRHYIFARSLRTGGIKDWKELTIERICDPELVPVAQLRSDTSFVNDAARAKAFQAAGHGGRVTFYRHVKRLPTPVEAPKIELKKVSQFHDSPMTIPMRKAK